MANDGESFDALLAQYAVAPGAIPNASTTPRGNPPAALAVPTAPAPRAPAPVAGEDFDSLLAQYGNVAPAAAPTTDPNRGEGEKGRARGIGIMQKSAGAALEMTGLAPETAARLKRGGDELIQENIPRVGRVEDIKSPLDAAAYAWSLFNEQAAIMAGMAGGALAGGGIAAAAGAGAGTVPAALAAGAGAALVGAPLNIGEIYENLRDKGIDTDKARNYALGFGVPATFLDLIFPVKGAGRVVAGRVAKEGAGAAAPGLGRRVAKEGAEGLATEALTETAQTGLGLTAERMATGAFPEDSLSQLLNAAVAGGMVGGTFGAATGIRPERQRQTPPPGGQTGDSGTQEPPLGLPAPDMFPPAGAPDDSASRRQRAMLREVGVPDETVTAYSKADADTITAAFASSDVRADPPDQPTIAALVAVGVAPERAAAIPRPAALALLDAAQRRLVTPEEAAWVEANIGIRAADARRYSRDGLARSIRAIFEATGGAPPPQVGEPVAYTLSNGQRQVGRFDGFALRRAVNDFPTVGVRIADPVTGQRRILNPQTVDLVPIARRALPPPPIRAPYQPYTPPPPPLPEGPRLLPSPESISVAPAGSTPIAGEGFATDDPRAVPPRTIKRVQGQPFRPANAPQIPGENNPVFTAAPATPGAPAEGNFPTMAESSMPKVPESTLGAAPSAGIGQNQLPQADSGQETPLSGVVRPNFANSAINAPALPQASPEPEIPQQNQRPAPELKSPRAPRRGDRPVVRSAYRAILDAGGVRDDEGHDILKGILGRRVSPLVRKNGNSVERLGEILWGDGWWGMPDITPRPGESEVLEFIRKVAFKERVVHPEDYADALEIDAIERAYADDDARIRAAEDRGIDVAGMTNAEIEAAIAAADSAAEQDAIIAAATRDLQREHAAAVEASADLDFDLYDEDARQTYDDLPPIDWLEADDRPQDGAQAAARGEGGAAQPEAASQDAADSAAGREGSPTASDGDRREGEAPEAVDAEPETEPTDQADSGPNPYLLTVTERADVVARAKDYMAQGGTLAVPTAYKTLTFNKPDQIRLTRDGNNMLVVEGYRKGRPSSVRLTIQQELAVKQQLDRAGVKAKPTERTDQGENLILGGGTERADAQAQAKKDADAKAEADARAQQSKIRRGNQQRVEDDEGSMFGPKKTDLFDAPPKKPAPPNEGGKINKPQAAEVLTDDRLPEGYTIKRGKGQLGKDKWGVFDPDDKMVWNLEATPDEAIKAALQRLESQRQRDAENAERATSLKALAARLRAGEEPTDDDLRLLDLKRTARFEWLSPAVQKLFGISKRRVREAMGDALRQATSETGVEYTVGNAKKALSNAAAWVNEQDREMYSATPRKGGDPNADLRAAIGDIINQISGGAAKVDLQEVVYGEGEGLTLSGVLDTGRQEVAGKFDPLTNLVSISLSQRFDPLNTAAHEMWHWLKRNRFFTVDEQRAMERDRDRLAAIAAKEIPGADTARMSQEELEAVAFAAYFDARMRGDQIGGILPALRKAFERLWKVLTQVRDAISTLARGGKLDRSALDLLAARHIDADSVFERALQGEIAARPLPTIARTIMVDGKPRTVILPDWQHEMLLDYGQSLNDGAAPDPDTEAAIFRHFWYWQHDGQGDPFLPEDVAEMAQEYASDIVEEVQLGRGPDFSHTPASRDAGEYLVAQRRGFAGTILPGDAGSVFAAAWHGTPHDFDAFSTEKIGTGEGAQAYGWGLYFAGKREVAAHYQERLSQRVTVPGAPTGGSQYIIKGAEFPNGRAGHRALDTAIEIDGILSYVAMGNERMADYLHGQIQQRIARHREEIAKFGNATGIANADMTALADFYEKHVKNVTRDQIKERPKGRLFKVDLAPAEDEYLLWDTAVGEMEGKVADLLEAAADDKSDDGIGYEIAKAMAAAYDGKALYENLAREMGEKEASLALRSIGIRGIKYLDGSSRNRPFKDVKKEFLDALPEDAEREDVEALIGTGTFSAKNDAVLAALKADDWLGFDYPSQAISAAYSGNLRNWDPSPALVKAVDASLEGGTFNYVIFDDKDVSITEKYSVTPAAARSDAGHHADLIVKYAAEAGWEVTDTHGSSSSASRYVSLRRVTERDADGDPSNYDEVKIRISDHTLPPSYGQMHGWADFEVSPDGGAHMDTQGDWKDALRWLAHRAGRPVPAIVGRVEKTAAAAETRRRTRMAEKTRAYHRERLAALDAAVRDGTVTATKSRSGATWTVKAAQHTWFLPRQGPFSPEAAIAAARAESERLSDESGSVKYSARPAAPAMPANRREMRERILTRQSNRALDWVNRTIGNRMAPLGALPEQDAYLIDRYRALGKVAAAEKAARDVFDLFSKATVEQAKAIYDYLTTAGARPDAIGDTTLVKAAMDVKRTIDALGRDLVRRGMIPKESYEKYKDAYLPRLYLKHLLDQDGGGGPGRGLRAGRMGYLRSRKNIPQEIRDIILGEVKDPAFLASRALGVPARDLAILDFLEQVAANSAWVYPESLTTWDGRTVSVFWLTQEAERLRKQAQMLDKEPERQARMLAVARQMDEQAAPLIEATGKAPADYRQIPTSNRYGTLAGMWVRREIYNDIVGAINFVGRDTHWLQRMFEVGGPLTKVTQFWKLSKVALNPPTVARNIMSNAVLLQLSGVPMHRLPVLLARALREIAAGGQYYGIAKEFGVTQASFAHNEMFAVQQEFLDLERDSMHPMAKLRRMADLVSRLGGNGYQFTESWFKVAKIIDAMERQNMPKARAALEAHKWLFDYSLVPPAVQYLRNAPIGVPFLCVDDQTEILTNNGWKTVDTLAEGDMAAGFDMGTGRLLWDRVADIYRAPYDGPMVKVQDRHLDMFLTPHHRCVTYRRRRTEGERDTNGTHLSLEIQTAENLNMRDHIPVAAPFDHVPEGEPLTDSMVSLLGWIAAEGTWHPKCDAVILSQNEGAKADIIRALLDVEAGGWSERKARFANGNAEHVFFYIPAAIGRVIRDLLPGKHITPALLRRLSVDQIRLLVDAMILGDGHTNKTNGRRCFIQNDGETLETFQMALVLIGQSFGVSKHGNGKIVTLRDGQNYSVKRALKGQEHYAGRIWCPRTEKTNTWVARRNGKVFVTGNTFYYKVMPRLLEVAMTKPWRCAPYFAMMGGLYLTMTSMYGVTGDDLDALKKALPEWLQKRGHTYVLPYKDDTGRWQVIDLGYLFPWGMVTESMKAAAEGSPNDLLQATGLFGGPVPDLLAAIKTGIDPFTKRPIMDERDPPAKQAGDLMNYLWRMAAPTWVTDIGAAAHLYHTITGIPNRAGDPPLSPTQAALRFVGVNVYPLEPEKTRAANIRRMTFEIQEIQQRMRWAMRDRALDQEGREAVRDKYIDRIKEKAAQLRAYTQASAIAPQLRT